MVTAFVCIPLDVAEMISHVYLPTNINRARATAPEVKDAVRAFRAALATPASADVLTAATDMLNTCRAFAVWSDDENNVYLRVGGRTIFGVNADSDEGRQLAKLGDLRRDAIAKAEGRS